MLRIVDKHFFYFYDNSSKLQLPQAYKRCSNLRRIVMLLLISQISLGKSGVTPSPRLLFHVSKAVNDLASSRFTEMKKKYYRMTVRNPSVLGQSAPHRSSILVSALTYIQHVCDMKTLLGFWGLHPNIITSSVVIM